MKLLIIALALVVGGIALSRLMAPRAEHYAKATPVMDIRQYFNGEMVAEGMILDWRGRVTKRFTATMQASWQGTRGTMKEDFRFDDGTTQQRTWSLELRSEHRFSGHAGDVVGVAQGEQYGNVARLDYVLRIPVNGKTYDIRMDDWLYLQQDGVTIINESRMTLMGLPVGRLLATFRKVTP